MEIQLQELIEQIKKDGVDAAEARAEEIIRAAKAEADKIIEDANKQASKMIADAKAENAKTVKSGEDAIRQACRNLLISFRESVSKELKSVTSSKVDAVYSSDELSKLIISVIENWAAKPEADDITVILNSSDLEKLEGALLAQLNAKLAEGVTLKANDNFDKGFRIAVNNGTIYYDYSAQAVTDMLSDYLSPAVITLLKEAE